MSNIVTINVKPNNVVIFNPLVLLYNCVDNGYYSNQYAKILILQLSNYTQFIKYCQYFKYAKIIFGDKND